MYQRMVQKKCRYYNRNFNQTNEKVALKKKKHKEEDREHSRIQKLILKFSLRNRLSQVSDDYQNRRSAGWEVKAKENIDEYIDPDWDGSSAGDSANEVMLNMWDR